MSKLGYTWYPKDWISDPEVIMMTAAERGVYRDLIDIAMINDNKIKYTLPQLCKYCNAEESTVESVLSMKGERSGKFWTIPSCQRRIDKSRTNRANGAKGGRSAQAKIEQMKSEVAANPEAKEKVKVKVKEKEVKFSFANNLQALGVSTQTAKDYLAVRKTKKLSNTATAFNGLKKEVEKAIAKKGSWTAEDIFVLCAERSWGGFKSDWLDNIEQGNKKGTAVPFIIRGTDVKH